MPKRTVRNETIRLENDNKTVRTETHYRMPVKGDNFAMVFLDDLVPISGITHTTDFKILFCLMGELTYNSNEIKLPSQKKKEFAERLNIAYKTVGNSLQRLKKRSLITGGGNVFYMNERFIWKGGSDKRKDSLSNK